MYGFTDFYNNNFLKSHTYNFLLVGRVKTFALTMDAH